MFNIIIRRVIATFICFLTLAAPVFSATMTLKNNQVISYTDAGHGTPLVLIHAFMTDQQLWDPQREALEKNFRVITLDLWGFGNSSKTDGKAVTMADYANEVNQLLVNLKIPRAIIGGESMGGYVALAFLDKYPNKVLGLILADSQSIADTATAKAGRESAVDNLMKNGSGPLIDGFVKNALSSHASEETKSTVRKIASEQSTAGLASGLLGMSLRPDLSSTLAKTTVPVLIITGEADNVISPKQSETMHSLAKNSTLVIIANAGHLTNLENPDKWNQAVINLFYKK